MVEGTINGSLLATPAVLGASGDLAKKKTLPALFSLFRLSLLPKNSRIIGYARTKMDDKEFHGKFADNLKDGKDGEKEEFLKICNYVPGAYDQDDAFQNLNKEIEKKEKEIGSKEPQRLFYMALPPNVFTVVAAGLKKNCYAEKGHNRIVIEKPFGKDLESCQEMMGELKKLWKEEETFRIDHYLGKEMVKNILLMRFANPFVEAGLNNQLVDNVQITFKEPFGTEGRGGYFDEFGIIRDIQQNHLTQVLSLLTMERPATFSAENIRDEKVKVLKNVPAIKEEDVLIGQYSAANGKPGYKDDDTVPKDSNCPTFAALALWVNTPRWQGVPFILKAGKALDEGKVEIRIQYRDQGKGLFEEIPRNELVLRIQPEESIYAKISNKKPGLESSLVPVELDFKYNARMTDYRSPEAYETLILDALKGEHSSFVREDELNESWRVYTPLLHAIDAGKIKNEKYEYGSRGPQSLNHFIGKYGYDRRGMEEYSYPKTSIAKTQGKI
ncbi:putative ZWF1-glucose-6-phosphate dehydrogenase [Jaminaea rosea]|uniref:Glucose-6-phosphate 1-dehydrogenase n=1 Tax=Jaminaea rosea TaxID=1569628 RepID=A0A316UI96_9BASI|nr:putative ZWF1-glucose-6-phosphate dehydrogenase [Jaminaea rosea]PWN25006.1 putative ZWF1-glucose-6-phosphate dehydrogenase [Jaminaea rosea]